MLINIKVNWWDWHTRGACIAIDVQFFRQGEQTVSVFVLVLMAFNVMECKLEGCQFL